MPETITMFACSHCKTIYRQFQDAVACETLGIPEQRLKVGDTINFEDESTMFGSRCSYSTSSGVVLFAYINRITNNKSKTSTHVWMYVVDLAYHEVEVFESEGEFGRHMFSPAELKFNKGYAASLQSSETTL